MKRWKVKQQDFLILLSLVDLGKIGTEKEILDNIRKSNYYCISKEDYEPMKNRHNQPKWEVQFAYRRNFLYNNEFVGKARCDPPSRSVYWYITTKGEKFIEDFVIEIDKFCSDLPDFPDDEIESVFLQQEAFDRAYEILRENNRQKKLAEIKEIVASDLELLQHEEEHFEGKQRERYTTYYERKPELRAKAISLHGTKCKACNFDFEKKYGERGKGFIEVHHLKPVSELGGTSVDPETDLTVVCSNCHRMIHRKKNEALSLEELKKFIQSEEVIRT